jgi:hypothetical protein
MPLPCLGSRDDRKLKVMQMPSLAMSYCKINMRILEDLKPLLPFVITIGKNEGIAIILPFYNL